jgi:hypothetical protein
VRVLLVVLGAGASFDSLDPGKHLPLDESKKPPLADELFHPRFQATFREFPQLTGIVDRLRNIPDGTTLEHVLEDLQEAANRYPPPPTSPSTSSPTTATPDATGSKPTPTSSADYDTSTANWPSTSLATTRGRSAAPALSGPRPRNGTRPLTTTPFVHSAGTGIMRGWTPPPQTRRGRSWERR